jgi:hypothetical protein
LAVANADRARVAIDRDGKLRAARQDFFGQGFRDFNAARAAEVSAHTVGNIRPAFEEHAARAIFDGDVQPTFEPNPEIGAIAGVGEQFVQGFGSLARSLH